MARHHALVLAACLGLPFASDAGPSREYGLGDLGSLQVDLQPGWPVTAPPPASGATISIEATPTGRMQILMTPLPGQQPHEEVRKLTQHAAEGIGPQSVEKSLTLKRLQGAQAKGWYFKATDPAPKAGEYRYLYQGTAGMRTVVVIFSVFYNDGAEKEAQAALEAVRGMKLGNPAQKHSAAGKQA